ncbi:hypothetical protein AMV074 [Betaentomopoxvirus amoorei]|uniref:AMV074 n=1 Tax=Amsacta moorei entomopoxvirus TaxID=28321 RepID=Q9EMX5_AMEPV|nr:hypothetical protein AMV074 [Amsacta moorei entomopoxvirus]AAG02780.1 AMV074 [Amsacta moorei entomopoxvirus]
MVSFNTFFNKPSNIIFLIIVLPNIDSKISYIVFIEIFNSDNEGLLISSIIIIFLSINISIIPSIFINEHKSGINFLLINIFIKSIFVFVFICYLLFQIYNIFTMKI